jgi:hypothetical protein
MFRQGLVEYSFKRPVFKILASGSSTASVDGYSRGPGPQQKRPRIATPVEDPEPGTRC